MILFLGLISWLVMGLITGLLAVRFLPGRPKPTVASTLLVALSASLAGGLLSSWLGFGGLATYDPRALVTALLTCLLTLTCWRMANLTP